MLCVMSNFMNIGVQFFKAYYIPYKIFGFEAGGPMSLMTCGIGYSNILFGIMFLEAYMGSETHRSCLGIKIRKIIIPWIYLVIIQLCFPEASMWGHLCGLISAVLLKHSGIAWVLLPHH